MSDVEKKPANTPRWIKIVLGISLSANLLVAGLAVGMITQVRKDVANIRAGESAGAYTMALRPQDRRDIGRKMFENFQQGGRDRAAIQEEYGKMVEILEAESFDRNAAQQVLQRQFDITNQRRLVAESLLLDKLESMSVEERREFAARLKDAARHWKGPGPRR